MLSFVETMRGTIREPNGAEHPIEFTVTARSESRGHFKLSGVVSAEPWAPRAEAEGTLVMSLVPPAIIYQLRFGSGLTLDARKDPSPLSPVTSFTFMPVTLRDAGGQPLAEGSMRFDLRDLPRFLASWLPVRRLQQKRLDAERRSLVRAQLAAPRP